MTKAVIRAGLVLGTLVLYPGFPSAAHDRATIIYFTKNENLSLYPAECVGIIATETIYANPKDVVHWKVLSGHGGSMDEDACTEMTPTGPKPMDKSRVQLVFKDNVVTSMSLSSNSGGDITGTVYTPTMPGKTPHKYHVMYKDKVAGPDPEIDVDCPGCGPGGGGPTK